MRSPESWVDESVRHRRALDVAFVRDVQLDVLDYIFGDPNDAAPIADILAGMTSRLSRARKFACHGLASKL